MRKKPSVSSTRSARLSASEPFNKKRRESKNNCSVKRLSGKESENVPLMLKIPRSSRKNKLSRKGEWR